MEVSDYNLDDGQICQGDSGSPLLDPQGKAWGVLQAIQSGKGVCHEVAFYGRIDHYIDGIDETLENIKKEY